MVEVPVRRCTQISVKEVQIGAMRAFATGQNPDLKQAQHELEAMKRELGKIECGASGPEAAGIAATPEGMDNLRLLRDMKYHETIFELLARSMKLPE